jgi:hypothetical protein
MSDDDFVSRTFERMENWEEWGRRLREIADEVKEKVGEAPLIFNEEGAVFMHPALAAKLEEPGNEGPMEFLRYMKRMGITKP